MPTNAKDALRARILAAEALAEAPGWRTLMAEAAEKRQKRLESLRQDVSDFERGRRVGYLDLLDEVARWPEATAKAAERELKRLEEPQEDA